MISIKNKIYKIITYLVLLFLFSLNLYMGVFFSVGMGDDISFIDNVGRFSSLYELCADIASVIVIMCLCMSVLSVILVILYISGLNRIIQWVYFGVVILLIVFFCIENSRCAELLQTARSVQNITNIALCEINEYAQTFDLSIVLNIISVLFLVLFNKFDR